MTRINIVEPHQLTKEHLLAEYRELPRAFTHILKAAGAGKGLDDYILPPKYTIGRGHVTFFYNKAHYLIKRWRKIIELLLEFGVNLDQGFMDKVSSDIFNLPQWAFYNRDYKPTSEEIYLNMYRLSNRFFFKLDNDTNDSLVLNKMGNLV